MPEGWRERAAAIIEKRSGVKLSGLANAWQYFFYLSLLTANAKGLVALVIPFEWVSRPSSKLLREYIKDKGWRVSVYRLRDSTFDRVLTTSSITIIDKRHDDAVWEFFQYDNLDEFSPLKFATGTGASVLEYKRRKRTEIHAKRGLSPGTQEALVLTEGERVSNGLIRGIDVVPCVTTLRPLMNDAHSLTVNVFSKAYVDAGKRCWLIRTDRKPSKQLMTYLNSVPATMHDTSTCSGREDWWRFTMPTQPAILCATGFRDRAPKVVSNLAGAMAVGGVCGIYGIPQYRIAKFRNAIAAHNFGRRVVSHSNGLRKIEINQMNAVLVGIEKKQKKNL
ncbi:MAG: class I SAM-dependent methyltransferase [Gammaproteobacteria bacterium]|nr:class I SAM-dependent methyltransferase [Gammaproteobacteria bacterium]